MITEGFSPEKRTLREEYIHADLIIVGGGMAGTCCAITAARRGMKVTLVQDRPVLGGNGSSEIRLWILGATSHMGNNNRWAREGGVIDEILVENLYRNPEGNPLILDTILLEKVTQEPNITLLLNTAMFELQKKDAETIESVAAFCSQNATIYQLYAPLFVDASGDGVVGFLAGAAFRMGAESAEEFGEAFAPDDGYGELLGHSLYFYSKDTGKPVRFVAPSYVTDVTQLRRFKSFNLKDHGCRLWWVEYGGRKDTIHESEDIKWELWKVIYGIWDHIKNSGKFPEFQTHTLEWVGTIPGKRESRRFEGDYMLSQRDVVEQRPHVDAVSHGGWALDLHPADGVYGDKPGCTQWHSKGIYPIPYRTMYSRNIKNLFLAGRIISASHVAFGSSRVMATCAQNAQVVAVAASLCKESNLLPANLTDEEWMRILQRELLKSGQYIPNLKLKDPNEIGQKANISVSSTFSLTELPADGPWKSLEFSTAQLFPAVPGKFPQVRVSIKAFKNTTLRVGLLASSKHGNFTPDVVLKEIEMDVQEGIGEYDLSFDHQNDKNQYLFLTFFANDQLEVRCSSKRLTGILSVFQKFNKAVAVSSRQEPPENIGIDSFDFWLPERRPLGHNLAFQLNKPINCFEPSNILNGVFRPTTQPNAWVAHSDDQEPWIELRWEEVQEIKEIKLFFDVDYDHPLESTLMGHPESEIPFCVKKFKVCNGKGGVLAAMDDNHQGIFHLKLDVPVATDKIRISLRHPDPDIPAALFGVLCY